MASEAFADAKLLRQLATHVLNSFCYPWIEPRPTTDAGAMPSLFMTATDR
jgi:hypothetical protein